MRVERKKTAHQDKTCVKQMARFARWVVSYMTGSHPYYQMSTRLGDLLVFGQHLLVAVAIAFAHPIP